MNFNKLLIHWSKLSVALVLLIASHVALHIEGAEPLARATLPGMSHTQADAEQQLQSMLANHAALSWSDLSKLDIIKCSALEDSSSDDYGKTLRDICFELKLRELKSRPPTMTNAYTALQNIYKYEVLNPRIENIRNYILPGGFAILYALVALNALWVLWQWSKNSGFPTLIKRLKNLPFLDWITPSKISQTAQDWQNDRTYRKAAEDFMHLDTLHKNDLISDEIFKLQKSELSAKLNLHKKSVKER